METAQKIPLLIIAGPTATGKTEVAVKAAAALDGEIVSADSMLIYRHMDIGTAKPDEQEKGGIPHYLIDIVAPDAAYSAENYQGQARQAIEDIHARGKLPILAGGTGFYIDAVIFDYDFSRAAPDMALRRLLMQEAAERGNRAVHDRLRAVDPGAAACIHPNNLKRVIRALEIQAQTGVAGALQRAGSKHEYPLYDQLFFCLNYERAVLYQRIEKRVDVMLARGLVREVRGLLEQGYRPELVAMQGLGYKEIVGYLYNRYSLEEAVQILKRNTRRFAKRQLTWFKRYSNIKWIDMGQYSSIDAAAVELVNMVGDRWQVDR
ncbi:MAG: tRNA (adenosine(37)-N6)-dimethylallyltransferase MiaA [Firmicutes bacterium]|nr:tRNA (adenosine(37)-N6)-dimethylallyltransferase MiaA [Bacillota bacterium]